MNNIVIFEMPTKEELLSGYPAIQIPELANMENIKLNFITDEHEHITYMIMSDKDNLFLEHLEYGAIKCILENRDIEKAKEAIAHYYGLVLGGEDNELELEYTKTEVGSLIVKLKNSYDSIIDFEYELLFGNFEY